MSRYEQAKEFIIDKMKSGLPRNLYYHGLHHTFDVLEAAERLGEMEKISGHEMELLRLAAAFHDAGHIINAKEHEKISCTLAREHLASFGYSEQDVETVCGMIMATRLPQHPNNLLEEIICDADLDYLGRDDFFEIGGTLYRELKEQGRIGDWQNWNKLQETFLTAHKYFTKSANELRKAKKEEHLEQIKKQLSEA